MFKVNQQRNKKALTPPDQNLSIYFFATSKLWYHLLTMELSVFGNHQGTSNKKMKNQGENNNKNKSHEFIQYIADLIGPLYTFRFSLSNTYISDPKREYK